MDKELKTSELIPGTRYWLDNARDVSGVFIFAKSNVATFYFIEDNYCYALDDNGYISLSDGIGGFYIKHEHTEIKSKPLLKYFIAHKRTFNNAFGSKSWKVYPSAWMFHTDAVGSPLRNLPSNWRELYDVVCEEYVLKSTKIVTK